MMVDKTDNYYTDDYFRNMQLKTMLAIAKGETNLALSLIDLMVEQSESPSRYASIGRLYLSLGELEKAANWFEKAVENHDWGLISDPVTNELTIPENLPDHPGLRKVLNTPELNALFEIRRKNLSVKE